MWHWKKQPWVASFGANVFAEKAKKVHKKAFPGCGGRCSGRGGGGDAMPLYIRPSDCFGRAMGDCRLCGDWSGKRLLLRAAFPAPGRTGSQPDDRFGLGERYCLPGRKRVAAYRQARRRGEPAQSEKPALNRTRGRLIRPWRPWRAVRVGGSGRRRAVPAGPWRFRSGWRAGVAAGWLAGAG